MLERAEERGQRRFRAVLTAYFRSGSWDTPETRLYSEAERLIEELQVAADWERAKADMDALIAADHDVHQFDASCDDCWSEAEEREAWGR